MMMKLTADSGTFEVYQWKRLSMKNGKNEIQYDMATKNQQQKWEETAHFTGEAMLV